MRVIENILTRYIEEDLMGPGDTAYRVPRFLQNDIARYWRTMAVDFAHKRHVRGARGWALRTAKLRMSRKLLYAAGLLTCFSCVDVAPRERRVQSYPSVPGMLAHLSALVRTTPLDILARVMLSYFGELSGVARQLFGAYDEFLELLGDPDRRKHLESLPPTQADSDEEYQRVRDMGGRFQDGLTETFFSPTTPLRDLTIRYGVF
jgi:hypothetical protein